MNPWSSIFSTVTTILAYYPLHSEDAFLSHPNSVLEFIFALLFRVPEIPLVAAVLAMITKWLIFGVIFRTFKWSDALRLCTVGIAEVFCLLATILIMLRLQGFHVPLYVAFVLYGVLAMVPNVLLSPLANQGAGYWLLASAQKPFCFCRRICLVGLCSFGF